MIDSQKKLSGEFIDPKDNYEEKVYKLVECIEEVFDRASYPKVYESLLLIHNGQKKSLHEQECISIPYEKELKELIKDNCITMVLFAIVASKEYFSKEYIKTINSYLPFTLNYIEGIEVTFRKKFKSLKRSYYGVEIEDILMYLFES